jgi:hypothetical protein
LARVAYAWLCWQLLVGYHLPVGDCAATPELVVAHELAAYKVDTENKAGKVRCWSSTIFS